MKTPRSILLVLVLALLIPVAAFAGQKPPASDLQAQINALATRVSALEAQVNTLQTTLANVIALAPYVTVTTDARGPLARFSGLNMQLVNGDGTTNTVNGLGNLIVGYDTPHPDASDKSGSHYLIVGDEHNYTAYGGLVVGRRNASTAPWASVTGGTWNTASGVYSSVSGGEVNTAYGTSSSVSGGAGNRASGGSASISGGSGNTAAGSGASISGGSDSQADGALASVSGGRYNQAGATNASITGGQSNSISAGATSGSVSGGFGRYVHEPYNWAAGSLFEVQ
jgi:trimeric autotransporter adhesin